MLTGLFLGAGGGGCGAGGSASQGFLNHKIMKEKPRLTVVDSECKQAYIVVVLSH